MFYFLLVEIFFIVIIIFLLYILSWFWPQDCPWAPWWSTDKKTALLMCKMVKMKKSDVVYDLGSGDGTALIAAAKEYGIKGVGVEIDFWRAWYAKKLVHHYGLTSKLSMLRANFFDIEISDAGIVFIYLIPKTIMRLKKKLLSELKPGAKIICYRYKIPYLPLITEDKEKLIYIYEIPKRVKSSSRIK